MRRLRALFSREVAIVVIGYLLAILLAVSFAEAFIGRQQAVDSLATARQNAIRRIDQLQGDIDTLENELRLTATRDAREQGRLEDAIRALAAQIRQAGGTPVTTGEPEHSRQPRPSRSARPHPQPSPRPSPQPSSSPSPSPSPSHCIAIPLHKPVCI